MVALVFIVAVLGARVASSADDEDTERIFTAVCDANNVSKAASIVSEEQRLALIHLLSGDNPEAIALAEEGVRYVKALNPILNCDATFDGDGRAVFLPPNVELEYLRLVERGFIPELEGGRIIGRHRPETGAQADF
jgi:hypothetical protein